MDPSGTPRATKRFRFRYTIFTVQAELGPKLLNVKMGIKMVSVAVARITHLYVHDSTANDHLEMLIGYTKKDGGRIRRARVFADREQPGFDGLVDALLERRPEVDIRGVHPSEAYTQMGAVEAEWLVIPGVMALGTLVVAGLLWPLLVHGFDTRAPVPISVAQLDGGERPATRNILLSGARSEPPTPVARKDGRPRWLVSLTPRVVLRFDAPDRATAEKALARPVLPGVLRNVWWEGLSNVERAALEDTVRRDALVIEVDGDRRADLLVVLTVLGVLLSMTGLTFAYLRARRPRLPV